jgi:hypothetical protein
VDVKHLVAFAAQRYQVLGGIVSQQAAWTEVMNLEIVRATAALAAPSISLKYLLPQSTIGN